MTKYLLKLEITECPDYDYGLPNEEMTSSAVYPHTQALRLEYFRGYPQVINIKPFNDYPGAYVTVEDVLRAIHEDLKSPLANSEFHIFGYKERAAIRAAFNERCETEEDLSKGPSRIDCLWGRNRLLISPKFPGDGEWLPESTFLPRPTFLPKPALLPPKPTLLPEATLPPAGFL